MHTTETNEREAARSSLRTSFVSHAVTQCVGTSAQWAPLIADTTGAPLNPAARRHPTMIEVMQCCLDLGEGPGTAEIFALVCAAARGADIALQAIELIDRMAAQYAEFAVE